MKTESVKSSSSRGEGVGTFGRFATNKTLILVMAAIVASILISGIFILGYAAAERSPAETIIVTTTATSTTAAATALDERTKHRKLANTVFMLQVLAVSVTILIFVYTLWFAIFDDTVRVVW